MINAYVARLTMLDENGDIVKEFAEAERYVKSIPDVIDFIDGEIRKAIAGGHYSTEIELKDPTRSLNAGYIAAYLNILGYEIIFRNDTKDNYHHFEIDWSYEGLGNH